jgi:CubicO group peptidase (beta-lactamase class C family)
VTMFKKSERLALRLIVLMGAMVLLGLGGSHGANAAAARAAPGAQARDALDRYMISHMKKARVPGVQVAVIRNGKLVALRSYGVADIEKHVAVNSQTVFGIASITKAFIGVAALQWVEQANSISVRRWADTSTGCQSHGRA